jgi:WD40 repeat protein
MGTIRFTVPDRVWSVAFSPDGQYLAVGTHGNGDIHLLDARTGLPVRRLLGHKGWGSHVRFLPDGTLLSANRAGAIWLWNIATGQVLRQLDPPPGLIQGLSLSSSGSLLATFGE